MNLFEAVYELFLPAACASCKEAPAAGSGLCEACEAGLPDAAVHLAVLSDTGAPPTVVAGAYEGPLAEALNEYKERGRRQLAGVLAGLLARPLEIVGAELPGAVLVPIPPTRAARRERGFDHVAHLCAGLGEVRRCLRARPRPDSVGLSRAQRREAARSSLDVVPRRVAALAASSRPVILVDDIVTTGATLSAAAAVLRRAGMSVPAAVAIAAAE
ncbi:ComF family protein [Glycomyces buryatensis]|uniref:ComF family protein n=1 Tax=Glycomyces buryatensis TaxID=2570927 RepID=A0A4S8QFP4_9ACTN|nr:ComF family protein [Glycomyces buryatensis]THV43200.1 ComF family protein [Glycomyces buryatensis]